MARSESELSASGRWVPAKPDELRPEPLVEPGARLAGSQQSADCLVPSPEFPRLAAQQAEQQEAYQPEAHPELEVAAEQSPELQQLAGEQRLALTVLRRA
ncbi:MAG: hypothetical protein ACRD8A_03740 [Candidatus Acidiferrales bacterium]